MSHHAIVGRRSGGVEDGPEMRNGLVVPTNVRERPPQAVVVVGEAVTRSTLDIRGERLLGEVDGPLLVTEIRMDLCALQENPAAPIRVTSGGQPAIGLVEPAEELVRLRPWQKSCGIDEVLVR